MSGPEETDGTALAAAIREGEITAVSALESALARAAEVASLGAIRLRADDAAFEAAHAIDTALAEGDLASAAVFAGVPFLMKDLGVRVRGLPTVAGSRAMVRRAKPAAADDLLTARFRASGLVIFGMTTVPEFGGNLICEPAIGPLCRNPLDPRRSPGGSSGGAASAVASGIVPFAHANDAAGSIRVPAACCGLVGLKPSRGATPAGPDFENYCAGIVANLVVSRSLRDTAAALAAIGGNPRRPMPGPEVGSLAQLDAAPAPLRIAVVSDLPSGVAFDQRRKAAILHAAEVLRRAGHVMSLFDPDRLMPVVTMAAEAAGRILCANLARILDNLDPPLEPGELELITEADLAYGRSLSGAELIEATIAMAKVSLAMADVFEDYDALLTPMLSGPPPMIGAFPTDHGDAKKHGRRLFELAPFAGLANVAGIPALTIPHGRDDDGLPLPVQLMAAVGEDGMLLKLGRVLEKAEPWPIPHRAKSARPFELGET